LRTESVGKWSPDFKSSIPILNIINSYNLFFIGCIIVWKVRQILSHLMIETFLFLLQTGSSYSLLLCCPPTPSTLPSSPSRRPTASSPRTEPILHVTYVSGLLSEVRIDHSDPNFQYFPGLSLHYTH
jgi:hypothetical protein